MKDWIQLYEHNQMHEDDLEELDANREMECQAKFDLTNLGSLKLDFIKQHLIAGDSKNYKEGL
jgi:hypothetical protein